ncbi:hypothetical protein LTR84_004197 [Exophiala bonariae]|uniref:Myb-like domain-containing protein n=1 Tax=Exophiala bonariae TaxID=1690606 RepID=A0AAV9N994_9EURO|nr:hypothetical protein LTR84_004197 [Exophiala bonariae]
MPFKWDAMAERNLLLHVIGEMNGPGAAIWEGVAAKLGGGLNGNACSQKFYKLKKESEKLLSGDGADTPAPAKPAATPRKPRAPKLNEDGTPVKATSRSRKKKAAPNDDGASESLSKKVKVEGQETDGDDADAATEANGASTGDVKTEDG